jgi:acetyl esterase/lipase
MDTSSMRTSDPGAGTSGAGASTAGTSTEGTAESVTNPGPTGAVTAEIETRPSTSRLTRLVASLLRRFVRPLLGFAGLLPLAVRFGFLVDAVAVLLPPPPRGTRRQRVDFEGFRGELILGPGVPRDTERVVLYFHGGGFFSCGLRTHRRMLARLSRTAQARVLHVAYRQLPITRLRGSIEDCLAGYRLLLDRGYPPEKIVFGGDSAGGYLVFAVARRAAELGLPQPAGILALSPGLIADPEHHREHHNYDTDPYIVAKLLPLLVEMLHDEDDPSESLLEADLSGLAPTLVQVGGLEVLLVDAELIANRLAECGVPVRLQVWEGQIHVFQAFSDLVREGHDAIEELGAFVQERTPGGAGASGRASAA